MNSSFSIRTFFLDDVSTMKQWDAFVVSHPQGTPYHLSGWLKTIVDTYGFKPVLYCLQNENGELAAVLPFFRIGNVLGGARIISLPFSDYGGLLIKSDTEQEAFIEHVRTSHNKNVKCIEIRGDLHNTGRFIRQNYYKRHLLNFQKNIDEFQKCIDKRTIQYSIRKAEKAGVIIKESYDIEGMLEFMRLNMLTRKKHGVPSQPKTWFQNLVKNVINTRNGFILLAELDRKVIGASIFLTCGKSLHYKYNASDPAVLRSVSPNHLLTWNAIKWGIRNNFDTLDFGRTSPDNQGLMRYKEMWGVTIADVPYCYYPKVKGATSIQENNFIYRLYTNVWRHLPDGIAEKLSAIIFKHLA